MEERAISRDNNKEIERATEAESTKVWKRDIFPESSSDKVRAMKAENNIQAERVNLAERANTKERPTWADQWHTRLARKRKTWKFWQIKNAIAAIQPEQTTSAERITFGERTEGTE